MKFKEEEKNQKKILYVQTRNWERIRYRDLFKIVKWLYEEEDRRYPPPKGEGGYALLKALRDLRTESVDEVAKGYGV